MATRGTNTMVEGLQKLAQDITALKFTPDADVAFLIALETQVLQKLREPYEAASGQLAAAQGPQGSAIPAGGGAPPAMPAMAGGGAMGGLGGGPPLGQPGGALGGLPAAPGPRFTPDMIRMAMSPGGRPQGG